MRKRLNDTEALVRKPLDHLGCGELSPGEMFEGACSQANPNAGAAKCASWGLRPTSGRNTGVSKETLQAAASYLRGRIR